MRFIVDAQLPPALARLLSDCGHTAEHVADLGLEAASDSEIWDLARTLGAAIVTKDEDFRNRQRTDRDSAPVIVWLRVGNTSRRALLDWFKPLLPGIESLIARGERLIEVR